MLINFNKAEGASSMLKSVENGQVTAVDVNTICDGIAVPRVSSVNVCLFVCVCLYVHMCMCLFVNFVHTSNIFLTSFKVGPITYALAKEYLDGIVLVSDFDVSRALFLLLER